MNTCEQFLVEKFEKGVTDSKLRKTKERSFPS